MEFKINKYSTFLVTLGLLLFLNTRLLAQITIDFPVERAVFQRDNNNKGNILISGKLQQETDRVEARLTPRVTGQGTATDWVTIDNQIDGLSYTGKIEGLGGWYKLEVRAMSNNVAVFSQTIQRVGIGEVFVIAGQSNAQGDGNNANPNSAKDDRVNGFSRNYFNHQTYNFVNFPSVLPVDLFNQIEANTGVGPIGYTAWCWGDLGDQLVSKLNVPVMFFNAAVSGTSTQNYIDAINNRLTYHKYTVFPFDLGMPYNALKTTLQSMLKTYGMRAILWHQGEFDLDVSEGTHVNNLKSIIATTRDNTGVKIPWVVSRVSRLNGTNYSQVIAAQNRVIAETEMAFAGPSTDDIQPNRPDGAHFANTNSEKGLTLLANSWNSSLNSTFFANSTPLLAPDIVEIKYNCLSQTSVSLKLDKTYTSYQWNTGWTGNTIQTSSGEYSVIVRDGFGNYQFSNAINAANVFPKFNPVVSPTVSLTACVGNSVELQSTTSKYDVNWNNGTIGSKLIVSNTSPYFAYFRSAQGCLSGASNQLRANFVDPPAKPNTTLLNSDGYVCEGGEINLKVENPNGFEVLWSTGEKSNNIKLLSNLPAPLKVKLFSNFDCPSPESNAVSYNFIKNPTLPSITKTGPFSIKAETEKTPSKFEWYFNNSLISNQTAQEISISQNGIYGVKAIESFTTPAGRILNCISPLSTQTDFTINRELFGISAYPNPVKDGIFYLTSDQNIENITVKIYNSIGQIVEERFVANLSLPVKFSIRTNKVIGKYFVQLNYKGLSRTFPLIFE
ncbi:sialate O-acetylesterase [Lacihabitans lacunae]|uniref:Sialate O-acetylesterase n=1 Tax=Lacihabitans lacunae TaxID=1028214 RepID=A0ABV7YVS6_9BACT